MAQTDSAGKERATVAPAPAVATAIEAAIAAECSCFYSADLAASDGATLRLHEAGRADAPPLLIINPIGVSVLLVARIARQLAERFRVVTWEQRGCGWSLDTFERFGGNYETFLQDVVDVFVARAGRACPIIAICSGASLAIKALARGAIQATTLTLVSPSVRFAGHIPSLYDTSAVPYMQEVVKEGRPLAELLMAMGTDPINSHGHTLDERVVRAADRAYLRSADSVLIQARSVAAFAAQTIDAELPLMKQPLCIACARDDEIVSVESARRLAALAPRARLMEHFGSGHHALYLDGAFRAAIAQELGRADSAQ